MQGILKLAVVLLVGAALGGGAVYLSFDHPSAGVDTVGSDEPQPLYWVAPMDPNYRRDKPGKSPMGMDLIPVYEEDRTAGPDAGPGTISIAPEVVNNLGVRTAQAQSRTLDFEVRTVGYVQYNEDDIVHIHPRVEGWIERLHVQAAGEVVTRGQPLYELYSPELVNAQEELVFGLNRGDTRLTAAAEARLRALNVDEATIATLKRTRKPMQTVRFHAPIDGVVDDFEVREGFFVKPGMTLMSIGALDEVWVEAEVFERQANLVEAGLPVTIALDYLPGREWQGQVDYVYPTLDPTTRTLRVRMRFANEGQALKPNMFANVSIHNESDEKVLAIPREAVIRGAQSDRVVLALGEGRFKSVAVTTGRSDGRYVEILQGLSAGDAVVTSAQFLLDSESSKTSDFRRMSAHEATAEAAAPAEKPASVWAEATINSIMAEALKINVDHAAIPEWGWPEMTMDFTVSEWVELADLTPGTQAQLEIIRLDEGGYRVNDIYVTAQTAAGTGAADMDAMDHSTMDHSGMAMPDEPAGTEH